MRQCRLAYGVIWVTAAAVLAFTPQAIAQNYNGVLVVGIPDHDANPGVVDDSGAVSVLHSFHTGGVSSDSTRFFNQSDYDFDTGPASNDGFGEAVVVADFNGDILPDIAIGVPLEDVGGKTGAGVVQVVYGSVFGFVAYSTALLHHEVAGIAGTACTSCKFGKALAAGDFNDDGYDDLAVGSPEYYISSSVGDGGAVNVIYGAADGYTTIGNQLWTQDSGILGEAEDWDRFGAALAVGDFDCDGYDDLAIGVPFESDDAGATEAGAVNVLYGSSVGLGSARNQLWTQGGVLLDSPESYDHFGAALAAGSFNGDSCDDLAIGVPQEDIGSGDYHGVVHMVSGWGAGNGLVGWNDELWSQDTPGMQDDADENDQFGAALAAGDFNGDGYDDLAVGSPTEDIFDVNPDLFVDEGGMIQIIFGSSSYLDVVGNLRYHQAITGVPDEPANWERFGTALAVADFDSDGYDDLAVGVPNEHPDGVADAGAIHLFYGSPTHMDLTKMKFWHLGTPSIEGSNQEDAAFGSSLAAMNFSVLLVDGFEHGHTNKWD